MAIEQLTNKDAIEQLDALAARAAAKAGYLFAGQPSGIDALIPGVTTKVLGPPTIDQWPAVAGAARATTPSTGSASEGCSPDMLQAGRRATRP